LLAVDGCRRQELQQTRRSKKAIAAVLLFFSHSFGFLGHDSLFGLILILIDYYGPNASPNLPNARKLRRLPNAKVKSE
jgi:hypothetical protein